MKRSIWIVGTVLVASLAAFPAVLQLDPKVAVENGIFENIQAGSILVASFVFLILKHWLRPGLKFVAWGGALLSLTFFLRELDVQRMDVPGWVIFIGSGTGRNLILGGGWIALGIHLVRTFKTWKSYVVPMLRSPFGVWMIAAALGIIVGDTYEHHFLGGKDTELQEEYFETIGFLLYLIAACHVLSINRISS